MGFTIPKKGSQNQDESLPPVNEAPAPQVNIASQPPPEEKKSPPSRPATRGKLLPSAVNSKRSHIYIKSEKPFIIKITLSPVNYGGNTPSSSRGSPRQRRGSKKYSDYRYPPRDRPHVNHPYCGGPRVVLRYPVDHLAAE